MIAQFLETAQTSPVQPQVAELATPDYEAKLEALEDETLFCADSVASLIELGEKYLKVRDRGDFEQAIEVHKELVKRIKLDALGMGITKEILDQHYQSRAA